MIEFLQILGQDGRPLVLQKLTHPAVYLDTWTLRLFAEGRVRDNEMADPALGYRFRTALRRAGGTLMLSSLSLGEFAGFGQPQHAHLAGQYVDTLFPNLFFSQFQPFKVIGAEVDSFVKQQGTPAGDVELLTTYAESIRQPGTRSLVPWFNHMYADRDNVRAARDRMAENFIGTVHDLRRQFTNTEFAQQARTAMENSGRPRATLSLLQALVYRILDLDLTIQINDAIDILHCIVPAAYGDFVTLDRRWYAHLQEAQRSLQQLGIDTPVARRFTQRDDGVIRFLETLEALPPAKTPCC